MQCFYITEENKIESISIEALKRIENHPYWIVLSKQEIKDFQEELGMSKEILQSMLSTDQGSKVEIYTHYDLGVLQRMNWQSNRYKFNAVYFFISREKLITVMDETYDWMMEFIEVLEQETEVSYTLGYIFYRVLDCIIADDKAYLSQMEKRTEKLEEDVLNEVVQHFIKDIIQIRKQIICFKRHYDPLTDLVEDLMSNENEMCSDEDIRYFKILKNRISHLTHFVDTIDDYTTHVREAYDAQIDIRLNRTMNYFTLITSLFLPLTLIVSWYGMNFENIPELKWKYGYPYVIILSILSSILCLYLFKKKKWL